MKNKLRKTSSLQNPLGVYIYLHCTRKTDHWPRETAKLTNNRQREQMHLHMDYSVIHYKSYENTFFHLNCDFTSRKYSRRGDSLIWSMWGPASGQGIWFLASLT